MSMRVPLERKWFLTNISSNASETYPSPLGGVKACEYNNAGKTKSASSRVNKETCRFMEVLSKAVLGSDRWNEREVEFPLAGIRAFSSQDLDAS